MEPREEVVSSSNPENHEKTLQLQSFSGNHDNNNKKEHHHDDEEQRDKDLLPPHDNESSSNTDDLCSFYNLPSDEDFVQVLMDQVVQPRHQERRRQLIRDDDHHHEERPRCHRRASAVSAGTSASTSTSTGSGIDKNEMMELLLSEYQTQPRLPLREALRAIHGYFNVRKSS